MAQSQPESQAFDSSRRRLHHSVEAVDVKPDGSTKLRIKIEPAARTDRSRADSPSAEPQTPTKCTPTLPQSLASPHSPSAYTYRIIDHTCASNPNPNPSGSLHSSSGSGPSSPTKKPSLALLSIPSANTNANANTWSPTVEHQPRPVTLTPEEQHALGFMPLRDDFEVEFDNTAEKALVEVIVPSGASLAAAHLTASSTSTSSSSASASASGSDSLCITYC